MKKCPYCGRDNEMAAAQCRECGREFPPSASPPPLTAPGGPPRTSGLAIASLITGVLGCFGVTALAGMICGIMGLVQISRSQGRLKGQGLAIAGICMSALCLLLVLPALLLPALAKAKARAQRITCVNHLRQLALAVRIYANENKDRFPSAENWCDAIAPHAGDPKIFRCPASRGDERCTYAYNSRLSGRAESGINPRTVMLFEVAGGWNISGGEDDLRNHDPHFRAFNVAFADGSVQQMSAAHLDRLRWEP